MKPEVENAATETHALALLRLAEFLGVSIRYVDHGEKESLHLRRADGAELELLAASHRDQGGFFVVGTERPLTGQASIVPEPIRDRAVAAVDERHGFTAEFAPSVPQHVAEYDAEEARLEALAQAEPAREGHTPGPWRFTNEPTDACCWWFHVETEARASAFRGPPPRAASSIADVGFEEDARLIAAAPELLAALEGLNHMGGADPKESGFCLCPRANGAAPDAEHATSCVDARAAVAKATGAAR